VADPSESQDLLSGPDATATRVQQAVSRLQKSLEDWQQANRVLRLRYEESSTPQVIDDDTLQELRELGYLD
jgi:hypothetical protein